jgi:hypothetical protein
VLAVAERIAAHDQDPAGVRSLRTGLSSLVAGEGELPGALPPAP